MHLVGLDAEEHDQGPFEGNAKAVMEYTHDLIGRMLPALPAGYAVALVSDHGFECVDRIANLQFLLDKSSIGGKIISMGGIAGTSDSNVADSCEEPPLILRTD